MTVVSTMFKTDWQVADGVNKNWSFQFSIFNASDARVEITTDPEDPTADVVRYNSDLSLTPANSAFSSGYIRFPLAQDPVAAGLYVRVVREVPKTQTAQLSNEGDFSPQIHERAFDRLTMQVQELDGAAIKKNGNVSDDISFSENLASGELLISQNGEIISSGVNVNEIRDSLNNSAITPAFYICRGYSDNGTDDDIRFAVDDAHAAGGGLVFDPFKGFRTFNNTVILPDRVNYKGSGRDVTINKAKAGLNAPLFMSEGADVLFGGNTSNGPQYLSISDCSIHGNKANNDVGAGIKLYARCYNIDNVKITYCKEEGITTKWSSAGAGYDDDNDLDYDPFMESLISNVFVGYCDHEGILHDGPHDSRMMNVLLALNSHTAYGSYSGLKVGSRSGGFMATMCHSWGETQLYAYDVEAGSTHFGNCQADDGYAALVRQNAADMTWVGGTQIGGFYATPPSALDRGLKGFVFGPNAYRPYIHTAVRNCPNGAIDFTNVNAGFGGNINILGALDFALQTAQTGQQTYGFRGTIPANFELNIKVYGVGNNFGVRQAGDATSFIDGSAAFPSIRRQNDITTGVFFAGSKVGIAVGGNEKFAIGPDYMNIPKLPAPPTLTPWVEGMIYYDTVLHKLRGYDGTAWQNAW